MRGTALERAAGGASFLWKVSFPLLSLVTASVVSVAVAPSLLSPLVVGRSPPEELRGRHRGSQAPSADVHPPHCPHPTGDGTRTDSRC